MKKKYPIFFLCIAFASIIFVVAGCFAIHGDLNADNIFEYRIAGGVPGDRRVDNVLTINNEGLCWYKTLKAECSFMIKQEEAQKIFKLVKKIIRNSQKSTGEFLPDSLISSMGIYDKELKYEVLFYAAESLEERYPDLRRPEQFKRLEKRLKELIKNHCDKHEDPYFLL